MLYDSSTAFPTLLISSGPLISPFLTYIQCHHRDVTITSVRAVEYEARLVFLKWSQNLS